MPGLGTVKVRLGLVAVTLAAVGLLSWLLVPGPATPRAAATTSVTFAASPAPAPPSPVPSAGAPAGEVEQATAEPTELSYAHGRPHDFLAYLPARRTSSMAVVLVHGGSWIAGDAEDTRRYNERLYALGIASFSIDYRLATQAPWPAQRHDLSGALSTIRAKAVGWHLDPHRIAVIGVSAGGHLALDLAGESDSGVCAVVSYSGPTSMDLILSESGEGPKQRRLARAVRLLAPSPADRRAATLPRAPGAHDAPQLLFAAQDEWVDARNTVRYADAYRGLPVDVEAVVLPGESRHASGYALAVPTVWSRTVAFLHQHCG